jgi:hypothetical protein
VRRFSGEVASAAVAFALIGSALLWTLAPFVLDRAVVVERDALSYFLPRSDFLARSIASGSPPWWNPAPVLGKPFFSDWQSAALYPPNLLLLVGPLSRGFNLVFIFHYAWAALGGLLWLRSKDVPWTSAALGTIAWSVGGPLLSLGHLFTLLMGVAWLPWVLWAYRPGRAPAARLAFGALALGMSCLTGAPEMILLIVAALILLNRDRGVLAVPVLALALAAAQLVPTALYVAETYRAAHGLDPAAALRYSATAGQLLQLFLPNARPSADAFLPSIYLGPIPCLLALFALLRAPVRVRLACCGALTVLVVLALGRNFFVLPALLELAPAVALLRYPEKLLIGAHALICAGAAFGAAALSRRLTRFSGPVIALLALATAVDLVRVNGGLLATLPPGTVFQPPATARAMWDAAPGAALPRYYANDTGRPAASSPLGESELDRAILFAGTGELYGLAGVNTPAAVNLLDHERLHRTLSRLPPGDAVHLLAAFGTRFVTSWSPLRVPGLAAISLHQSQRTSVPTPLLYQVVRPRPIAYLADRVVHERDPDRALALLAQDPEVTIVAPETGVPATMETAPPSRESVRWLELAAGRAELALTTDRPALLVVNQTYFDGWSARVDGAPTTILRVNAVVQGLWLDAGSHRIEMTYAPPGLRAGLAASVATLVLIALLLARARVPAARGLRSFSSWSSGSPPG